MTPYTLDRLIVVPTLSILTPSKMNSTEARVMLLAIALQESGLKWRKQVGGPAKGWWQFEEGGVSGVMKHHATQSLMNSVCLDLNVSKEDVYVSIEQNDVLACAVARALLYTHPDALPKVWQEKEAWNYYLWLWRPGKPREETWHKNFSTAKETIMGI